MATVLRRVQSSALADDLPSEFRIFTAGVNPSSKGDHIFDARAAESVMAWYRREGVDMMIDLEHHALDASAAARADAADARGWFQLELRQGELWAVNVRWTPDGMRRLAERTQRYTSPAFMVDESGRITRLLNVALVSMPATFDAQPLIAASRVSHRTRAIAYEARELLSKWIPLKSKPRSTR